MCALLARDGVPVAEELTTIRTVLEAAGFGPLLAVVDAVAAAYPNDPGTSDLDDEQAVTITLGTVRRAWAALAKVDR
jgi:hypothetical protein